MCLHEKAGDVTLRNGNQAGNWHWQLHTKLRGLKLKSMSGGMLPSARKVIQIGQSILIYATINLKPHEVSSLLMKLFFSIWLID